MPVLDTVPERSDGGYAVKDFRKVQPALVTMEDLEGLTAACHEKGIQVCMDFVMNHTSEDHEWAQRARRGEGEYMGRYFFFGGREIPDRYEQTVPQVFPTTAPGNFTWLPECNHYVMTTSPSSSTLGQTISPIMRIMRTMVCTCLRFRQEVPSSFQM